MAQDGSMFNPPIPCVGYINGGMTVGKTLLVQGQAPHNAGRFSINFTNGGMDKDYIFHYNPRFAEKQVVRNSRLGGSWGPEERQGSFPFQQGQPFEVAITAQQDRYTVTVNGQQSSDYRHRVPMERATNFVIEGEVAIQSVRFQYGAPQWTPGMPPNQFPNAPPPGAMQPQWGAPPMPPSQFPNAAPGAQPQWAPPPTPSQFPGAAPPGGQPQWAPPPVPSTQFPNAVPQGCQPPWGAPQPTPSTQFPGAAPPGGQPQWGAPQPTPSTQFPGALTVPYCAPIPGGLRPGRMVTISGSTTQENHFAINLAVGPDGRNADIGFHFNPRFDNSTVVRNSFMRGAWGTEDRNSPYFPFRKNTPFELIILAEAQGFKVAVNGQHFIEYAHRLHPLESLQYLTISGGVRLQQVQIY